MRTSYSTSSSGPDLVRLRRRIIRAYRLAQEVIVRTNLVSPSRVHGLMLAYDKACTHLRANISLASNSFPSTDALVTWLLDDSTDESVSEADRAGLELAVRAMKEEIEIAQERL